MMRIAGSASESRDTGMDGKLKLNGDELAVLSGDGVNDPDNVALMGHFDIINVSATESWVTVGQWLPRAGYRGDVLLARIRWSTPNRLPLW